MFIYNDKQPFDGRDTRQDAQMLYRVTQQCILLNRFVRDGFALCIFELKYI